MVAATAAMLCPDAALAQAPEDSLRLRPDSVSAEPVYELTGLVVRVARPAATTGGASAVVATLDSLPVPPAPTLEQALRALPLIQIRANSRGEAQPALRGGEDRQIAVLVDGIPVTLGWDHRTDLSIIPLTAARSITLVRGLPSLLYGPNVLAGAVEVSVADDVGGATPAQAALAVDQAGGRQASLSAGWGAVRESPARWSVRTGMGYRERPGLPLPAGLGPEASPVVGADGLRANSDLRALDGFVAAGYRTAGGGWLSLLSSAVSARRGVPPETHVDAPRLWRYPSQRRLFSVLSAGTGQRRTRWGAGSLRASVGLDLASSRIDAFEDASYGTVTGGESDDDRTLTVRLGAEHEIAAAGAARVAATLADVAHDEVLTPGGAASYRQRLWSLGTELGWRLERVPGLGPARAVAGLAVDGADTPLSGDKPPLGRLWAWGARAGVSAVSRSGRLLLHAAASRRSRFPSLRELYSGALGKFEPNPGLRPETLLGVEAGATVRYGAVELQAVAFQHRLRDAITRTAVVVDGQKKYQRVNRDEVRSLGVELLARWRGGGTSLSGDVTLQRVRLQDGAAGATLRPEYEPALSARLRAAATLPLGVAGAVGLRYIGRQYCVSPDAGGTEALAASGRADAELRRDFGSLGRRLTAALLAENVTDALAYDQCGLPQPGRTLRLELRVR